jgi:hypothetical protein
VSRWNFPFPSAVQWRHHQKGDFPKIFEKIFADDAKSARLKKVQPSAEA